ncbi:hypothetical protein KJ972_05575, partial [Candidatus Micrarchaeota archaeon]|nr:hypothetical protein [Candidatus Micrarchaeota archaeon]
MLMAKSPRKPLPKSKTRKPLAKQSPEDLFKSNQKLARLLVNRFWERHYSLLEFSMEKSDVLQHAFIAMFKASKKFVPAKGFTFGSYGGAVVKNELKLILKEALRRNRIRTTGLFDGVDKAKGTDIRPHPEMISRLNQNVRNQLVQAIGDLPVSERNKEIFMARYGLLSGNSNTLKAVGRAYGVSR